MVTPSQAPQWYFPKLLLALWYTSVTAPEMPVLYAETGRSLEYLHLYHHPKYQKNSEESYYTELWCLCQVIGTGKKVIKKQWVAVTETFQIIPYKDVPADRRKEVTYMKVVCKARPQKYDPKRTWLTIGGNVIIYPGDEETSTEYLKLTKTILNSFLSSYGAKFD